MSTHAEQARPAAPRPETPSPPPTPSRSPAPSRQLLPAPRPGEGPAWPLPLPAHRPGRARDRVRARGGTPLDVVTFSASCPACGEDCEWTEERVDTRLRVSVGCSCSSRRPQGSGG